MEAEEALRLFDSGWADFERRTAGKPELLAHAARWHDSAFERISMHLAGRPPVPIDADERNAVWMAEDQGIDAELARERAAASYRRLRELVGGLPPERWDRRVVHQLRVDTWEHYPDHL